MAGKKVIFISFLLLFILALGGCKYQNAEATEKFVPGDIKDDFCGVDIGFQYCKCAFHGEYCDAIGMSKKEAKEYVEDEYEKWLLEKEEAFALSCKLDGGYYDPLPGICVFCKPGTVFSEKSGSCAAGSSTGEEDEAGRDGKKEASSDEKKEEQKKAPMSQADCDKGSCFVNNDCLPMLIECRGGAFMKPWAEVCQLAQKYPDGQPLPSEICYCHGAYCYVDQKCQELDVEQYCGDKNNALILNPETICEAVRKNTVDIEKIWAENCSCKQGYCKTSPGNCEELPNMEKRCEAGAGAKPKSTVEVCETMKRVAENKLVLYFDWCDCLEGYDEDWDLEICVKKQ